MKPGSTSFKHHLIMRVLLLSTSEKCANYVRTSNVFLMFQSIKESAAKISSWTFTIDCLCALDNLTVVVGVESDPQIL